MPPPPHQLRLCWEPLPAAKPGRYRGSEVELWIQGEPQHGGSSHGGRLSSPGDGELPVPPTPARLQALVKPPRWQGKCHGQEESSPSARGAVPRSRWKFGAWERGCWQPAVPGRGDHPTALLGFIRPLNGGIVRRPAATCRCRLLCRVGTGLASPRGMCGEWHQPPAEAVWLYGGRNLGAAGTPGR